MPMNQQIYEEACDWFVRMRDGESGAAAQSALMAWLTRSPEHVSAYLDIAAIWREAANVQVDAQLDIETRIAAARADSDVVNLHPISDSSQRLASNTYRYLAIAAGVIVAIGAVFLLSSTPWGRSGYSTQLGEIRSLTLSDGSTVELNSGSEINIEFAAAERRIELLEGQALFRVAKDRDRPFIVTTSDASVRAVGTVFDIYRKKGGAVVTVLEGSVAILPRPFRPSLPSTNTRSAPTLLAAGTQAAIERGAVLRPKPVNVAAATAWTRRQLVFEFTPLQEAAEEFNRYNARKLIVAGEPLRRFKISAIFESTDPAALVKFLRGMPGVQVRETDDSVLIVSKDDTAN